MVIIQTVTNDTPYTWHCSTKPHGDCRTLNVNTTKIFQINFTSLLLSPDGFGVERPLLLRYEGHSEWDLSCPAHCSSFTLRESDDREEFELVDNNSHEVVDCCPNFGTIEEEKRGREERKRRQKREQDKREEEEKRRQAQLEQTRRIQEKTKRQRREWKRREWEQCEQQRQEWERQEREEWLRRHWERQEQQEKERHEQLEQELEIWKQLRKIQKERQERELQEQERQEVEKQEQQRHEWERWEQRSEEWKRQRQEAERQEQERQEVEKQEHQRQEWERWEQRSEEWKRQREERERQEQETQEVEKQEQQRQEWERWEQRSEEWKRQRQEREKQEQERQEWERWEQRSEEWKRQRQEREKQEQERQEWERWEQRSEEWKRQKERNERKRQEQEQQFKSLLHDQQPPEVLLVEDPAPHIERDEIDDVNAKFEELLSTYQITENKYPWVNLNERMKSLQNELTLSYLREHNIPIWSQWTLDQATGYVDLSLTERFNILEAVVKVTLDSDPDVNDALTNGQDKKMEFLLSLQDQLHISNPTLARQVLLNVLKMIPHLPQQGRELLSQILFNNIWTPREIKLFIGRTQNMDQDKVTQILHKACTYRLSCILALSTLNHKDPVDYIQDCISYELDKDVDTILSEMQKNNYSERILSQLEYILRYVEEMLPKYQNVEPNDTMIKDCKRLVVSLDLANPNTETLRGILIMLSIAVKKCTAVISSSGGKVQGYFPRLTQLASLLLLLLPQCQDNRGCLLEIGTGEGKTCILAMFATIQALRGTAVDVVTSSPLLAVRDQFEWRELYAMFGVTSSTVPPQQQAKSFFMNHETLLEEAYSKQIVYGTVTTFAGDILRQDFERKTTRGKRKCECVIVDEVDYMTLDKGVQVTYLSHPASVLRHLEQVLAGIWAMMSVCRPIEMFETGEIQWGTRIQHCHMAAKQAVIGSESDFSANDILLLGVKLKFYTPEDIDEFNKAMEQMQTNTESCKDVKHKAIENLMAKMGPNEQYELIRKLETTVSNSVAVNCFSLVNNQAKLYQESSAHKEPDVTMLLLENGCSCEILSEQSLIEITIDKLKSCIKYSSECALKSLEETKGQIVIPSVLKEYTENQLPTFAKNALKAIQMINGREYMIEKSSEADRPGFNSAESHQYDTIIPVDFQASGVLEKNTHWGDGLQQFLEMKHQLAISQLSNVTNYMSNVYFFKKYVTGKGIFGVSGTLGGKAEKTFLERQYKTASYVIPVHRHKKLIELPAVQSEGNTQWIQVICETASKTANRGQVVLIICEDVKTADELKSKMCEQERQPGQITMYTISAKHNIEKQIFGKGSIIIATNLGGRGTDIQVHHEVNECGGLFVLLTYFPESQRVERQVFGRTARKGNPGMAQMILNQDLLAPAYRGHSVETMRQLREKYELSRLDGMERNELFAIEMEENLFTAFCEFLCDFDKNYTEDEKMDWKQMRLKDVPECFKIHRQKFDYQTAVNALKESWALWLILHEENISRHKDINMLKENLDGYLKDKVEQLLKGKSNSFYDYIELAKSRTDMHRTNKKGSDYGALAYWKRSVDCDPFYSAVALYNQAYITVNLQKSNYMTEAKRLLEKAKTALDVYLSESSNTMMFCNLSVTKDFVPHRTESNLQTQMKARMSVFKSWKGYIENALNTLEQIERSKGKAITEDSSVYSLSRDKDPITTTELMTLHELGLSFVFEVKKKPEFSLDALACFCLGVLQVAAGVLVCALSSGTASQFGLGLISEGVSDMIHGIKGMIQGSFDWAEWAISKAISIGVSLAFGGLSKLKTALGAVRSGAKGLVTAAKCSSAITMKQCFKHAAKYAVQELGKQGCIMALDYTINAGLTAFLQNVLKEAFKDKVFSMIKANGRLNKFLTNFICSEIPKTAMEQGLDDFRIDRECERAMRQSVDLMTQHVIPDLMMDCTKITKVLDSLSEVCGAVTQHLDQQKQMQNVMRCLKAAQYITHFVQMFNSFPREKVINETFVPQLLRNMNSLPHEKYDQDGRHNLSDVKRLKDELLVTIAESVSDSFVEACSRHMTSIINKTCVSKINSVAGKAASNLLGRSNTHSFFDNQQYKQNMKKAVQSPRTSLTDAEQNELDLYINKISDVNHPATALDIHVLTQSHALQGKGIKLIVVDKHGKKLSEDFYPGTNSHADDIVLQLRKDKETPKQKETFVSKVAKRLDGEQSHYTGHFEILRPDGSVIPVNSENQNCLYHAIAQSTSKNPADLKQKAAVLRNEVKNNLLQDKHRYASVLKLQQGYEETYKSPVKYTICGGGKKTQHQAKERFKDVLNVANDDLSDNDVSVIKTYNLGLVGTYEDVKGVRKANGLNTQSDNNSNSSPVNADHIPPINTFQRAHKILQNPENREIKENLKTKNPKLFEMICKNGNRGLCKEVLTHHHHLALTTGNSKESHKIRGKLADVLLTGDSEKLIKMSMIVANPEMSESLRRDAGIPQRKKGPDILSSKGTRRYHNTGDKLLLDKYCEMGVIDQRAEKTLNRWHKEQLYSRNSPEYHELLDVLTPKKHE